MKGLLLILAVLIATPIWAVEPDEVLADPLLEARARDLSAELRCLVCRNESIDESNADLARDLRVLVRDRLVQGDTNEEVMAFIVDRYGEYVLLRPTLHGSNLMLWLAGPGMLLVAGLGAAVYLRGRRATPEDDAHLSAVEQDRVRQLLDQADR